MYILFVLFLFVVYFFCVLPAQIGVIVVCVFVFVACLLVVFVCAYVCMQVLISVCDLDLPGTTHTCSLPSAGIRHALKGQLLWTFLATSANPSECYWHGGQRTQYPRCPALLVPPSVRGRHCTETCRTNTRTPW